MRYAHGSKVLKMFKVSKVIIVLGRASLITLLVLHGQSGKVINSPVP